ncbi:hypothetical protein [Bartonella sp. DGB1]|uniref:hypothetical protein n=1 Tax=Bartonella sp. DGB1 TaxID=3239807 RepID=UPI003524B782
MIDKHIQIPTLMHSIIRKIDKLLDKKEARDMPASLTQENRKEILELLKQEKYKDGLTVTEITSLVGMNRRGINSFMSFLVNRGSVTRFKGVNRNPNGGRHKEVYYYVLKGE